MRTLILLSFLISLNTLMGQQWETAEWIYITGESSSGSVEIPRQKWVKLSSIKLKPNIINGRREKFTTDDLLAIYTLEGDTLLRTAFFEGKNHQLQTLLKGEITLLREVTAINNFFILHNDSLIHLNKHTDEEQFPQLLEEECKGFARRSYSYNIGGLMRVTRALNKCINGAESKWLSSKWGMYKWRYTIGAFFSYHDDLDFIYDLGEKKKKHFQLGLERNFTDSAPHLSFLLQTSYNAFTINDFYYVRNIGYKRVVKKSFLKLSTGFRAEFLPRSRISPFILGGGALSKPLKSYWTFNVLDQNVSLNGFPVHEEINEKIPSEVGFFLSIGLRVNLSNQTRLSLVIRNEFFPYGIKSNYLSYANTVFVEGLGIAQKTTPDEYMIGISLARAFSMGM